MGTTGQLNSARDTELNFVPGQLHRALKVARPRSAVATFRMTVHPLSMASLQSTFLHCVAFQPPIAVDRHPGTARVAIDPNADVLVCRDGDLLGSQANCVSSNARAGARVSGRSAIAGHLVEAAQGSLGGMVLAAYTANSALTATKNMLARGSQLPSELEA